MKGFKKLLFIFIISLIIIELMGCRQTEEKLEEEDINIDSFFNLRELILENDFTIERNTNKNELYVEGMYDLNKDGKTDMIEAKLLGRRDSYLKVNNSQISMYSENPQNIYLVDLIPGDEFIEIAIYDDGPSGDPTTTIYRYDGQMIHELGLFYTDINLGDSLSVYYGNVLTDGKGKFIPPGSIIKFVTPNILKGYYSIKDNKLIFNPADYDKKLEDDFFITDDMEGFFIKQSINKDMESKDIEFIWDINQMTEFKKGEKIKIIAIGEFWYGIERQDGTTGILYFWIGD